MYLYLLKSTTLNANKYVQSIYSIYYIHIVIELIILNQLSSAFLNIVPIIIMKIYLLFNILHITNSNDNHIGIEYILVLLY